MLAPPQVAMMPRAASRPEGVAMSIRGSRSFELMTTVTFPSSASLDLNDLARKLSEAVREVLAEGHYVTVVAFLVQANTDSDDISYGLRFDGADPRYLEDMATEVFEAAVKKIAEREGTRPIEAEQEESVLVLT